MSNLGSLIAILGSAAAGYGRGQQIKRQNDREDARDAQQQEMYDFEKEKRDNERSKRAELATASRDIVPEVTTNTGATYQDADLMASDNRENRRNFEQTGMAAPAPMTANAPTEAQHQTQLGVNSRASKLQRSADIHRKYGDDEQALRYEEFAKQAIAEGADQTLGAISAAAPALDAVKKAGGTIVGKVGADAADAFNKTGGKWKITPDTPVQHFIDKDAAGREFVNSRVMGKDGREVVGDVVGMGKMLLSAKERFAVAHQDTQTFQTGQQIAESGRHNKAQEQRAEADSRRTAANQAAQLGISQQHLKMAQQAAADATPSGKIAAIEKATGVPMSADEKFQLFGRSKIAEQDKLQLSSIFKEQESISAARTKGEVDGTLAPDSPGFKSLQAREAALALRARGILSKYDKGGAGASNHDPYGVFADKPAPAPAAKAAPVAAMGTRLPSEPAKNIWIGNKYSVNPAWTAWDQQYGAAARGQSAAENARLIGAYQRSHD